MFLSTNHNEWNLSLVLFSAIQLVKLTLYSVAGLNAES